MKLKRPDLVVGHMQQSKREKAYPFVVGFTVVAIIILLGIKECM